jgi:hypothetical protein
MNLRRLYKSTVVALFIDAEHIERSAHDDLMPVTDQPERALINLEQSPEVDLKVRSISTAGRSNYSDLSSSAPCFGHFLLPDLGVWPLNSFWPISSSAFLKPAPRSLSMPAPSSSTTSLRR